MKTDDKVQGLLDRVGSGSLQSFADRLGGSDFGLYVPVYDDGGTLRVIPEGYSQLESNLAISVQKKDAGGTDLDGMRTVAWMGDINAQDSKCKHGGTSSCKHCTGHTTGCKHCSAHTHRALPDFGLSRPSDDLEAPALDYDDTVKRILDHSDILKTLAPEGFGLALLHGHNQQFEFTKLPEDMVAVISNGATSFRPSVEVDSDPTFIPNMWRFSGGSLKPAGGYSER